MPTNHFLNFHTHSLLMPFIACGLCD